MFKRLLIAGIALLLFGDWASAAPLFGVTTTHLVVVDPSTANITSVVGPLNLPSGTVPTNLTYHPGTQMLYALAYQRSGSTVVNQHLVSINPSSGQGNIIASLGNPLSIGYYESLEYVHSLGSLVTSKGSIPGNFVTNELLKLNLDGTTSLLVNTSLDNDFAVYDPTRDYFYTTDPNGILGQQFFRINLSNGALVNLGPIITTLGELAYSLSEDVIYALDYTNNRFYRVQLTNGGPPVTITLIGTTPGNQLQGIAFASASVVPEPGTLILLTSALVVIGPTYVWQQWGRGGARREKVGPRPNRGTNDSPPL